MRAWLLVLVVTAGLAGCAGSPQPMPLQETAADDEPVPVPDIFGLVLDEAGERLANATVAVEGLDVQTRSAADGGFAIYAPEAEGRFDVLAEKDGYTVARARVSLAPAFAVHIVFTLTDVEALSREVYVDVFRGFLPCTLDVGTGPQPCPASEEDDRFDAFRIPTDVAGDLLRGIVVEAFWEPGTLGAAALRITVEDADGTAPPRSVEGGPGIGLSITAGDLLDTYAHRPDLIVRIEAPDGTPVRLQQEFEAFTSFFINKGAPDGYSVQGS